MSYRGRPDANLTLTGFGSYRFPIDSPGVSIGCKYYVLAFLIGFVVVSGLAWFFAVLILLGLSSASGPAHRIDLPFFAAILVFGLILVVAVLRDLLGWLRRRGDRDIEA